MISSSGMWFTVIYAWLGLWLSRVLLRTNGGPGCSSLEGSFQENGVSFLQIIPRTISETAQPFTWRVGQALPTQNEWSWTNLSSVLYVEQPIGTGFSQGTPTAMVRRFRSSMNP